MGVIRRLGCAGILWLGFTASAADITLTTAADTSILETAPNNNMGHQLYFSAGTTQNGPRTRGLMQFDLSSVPAGSTITAAELVLETTGQPVDGFDVDTFGLYRVLQPWGEGTKTFASPASPGQGAPATVGEATWNQRLNGSAAWSAPGGLAGVDFVAATSAEQTIFSAGLPYSFGGDGLLADLQFWLDHPDANFGWMLKGENESLRFTARRFGSHESAQDEPLLFLSYTTVPEPATWTLFALGAGGVWLIRRRSGCP